MRQLASIQRIGSLTPIVGADMIEKATVLGWELCVAKKDNFRVGGYVYFVRSTQFFLTDRNLNF
jgi:hypothetical protein